MSPLVYLLGSLALLGAIAAVVALVRRARRERLRHEQDSTLRRLERDKYNPSGADPARKPSDPPPRP